MITTFANDAEYLKAVREVLNELFPNVPVRVIDRALMVVEYSLHYDDYRKSRSR